MPHFDEQTTDERTPEEPDPREVNKQAQRVIKPLLAESPAMRLRVMGVVMLVLGLTPTPPKPWTDMLRTLPRPLVHLPRVAEDIPPKAAEDTPAP